MHQLTENIKHVAERPFLNKTLERKAVWDKWMEQDKNNNSKPLRPERLMASINKFIKDDAVISADVGTATVWSTRYLNLGVNNKFIISSWLGTMGCGLPGAMASKLHIQIDKRLPLLVTVHSNGNARLRYSSTI